MEAPYKKRQAELVALMSDIRANGYRLSLSIALRHEHHTSAAFMGRLYNTERGEMRTYVDDFLARQEVAA